MSLLSPEFTFDFDASLFPGAPPLPASADLFSQAETSTFLGFLDNFTDFEWDCDHPQEQSYPSPLAPYSNPHLNTAPEPSTSGRPRRSTRSASSGVKQQQQQQRPQPPKHTQSAAARRPASETPSAASESSATNDNDTGSPAPPGGTARAPKALLSQPQKRLNHIMSEQKRRNAIRDGYAQLIALLAPAGSAPGLGMPQRGRPKGSSNRGKGQSKGKSGVLCRAVQYCRWLEEGRDALRDEVMRVEAAAGIRHHSNS
ncbi:hypothetical protein C8J57DRAFT_1041951 [Mycena rebaudengoi]|nr:hypothetical protein C8J57DRAFT_1041951 [Mycena rebaudengoi]